MRSANMVDLAPQWQSCILVLLAFAVKSVPQNIQPEPNIQGAEGMSAGKSKKECALTDRQTHMHHQQPQQGRMLIICHHAV